MHTLIIPYSSLKHCNGATLLEVMIAMVILAIGLLGLAGLQSTGISSNSNAEKRTQATIVANDFIERMRANQPGVTAGNYAAIDYANIDCNAALATFCQDRPGNDAAVCSSQQVATFDAFIAVCDAGNRLPAGSLNIRCTDNAGVNQACNATPFRTITVNWTNTENNVPVNKNMSLIFRP